MDTGTETANALGRAVLAALANTLVDIKRRGMNVVLVRIQLRQVGVGLEVLVREIVAVVVLIRRVHLPRPTLCAMRSAAATTQGRILARMNEVAFGIVHDHDHVAASRRDGKRSTRERIAIGKGVTGTTRKRKTGMRSVVF